MMHMNSLILRIAILLIICTSCITIIGLTDDFDKLNSQQKSLIHKYNNDLELTDGNVYLINAKQLKNELSKYKKSIVYCFTNGCSSEFCEPMRSYLDYAKENGYKLFLVMNGFGNLSSTLDQSAPTPYFAIDSEHYQTKYRSKYTRQFINELLSRDIEFKEKEYLGNLFFFQGTKYLEARTSLRRTSANPK